MFKFNRKKLVVVASGVTAGVFGSWYINKPKKVVGSPNDHPISRSVKYNDNQNYGLNITVFQYETCPFCCKLRAFLDYRGINYSVVEVNSVTQKEIKWSNYRKVPIAVLLEKNSSIQLNDSSVIISIIESYLRNKNVSISNIKDFYPSHEVIDNQGNPKLDFYNKYQIMMESPNDNNEKLAAECRWRQWVDDDFVHCLAPNIYRTPSEALEAFYYVSDCGNWEKYFGYLERIMIIYVGATAMYFVGKMLKKRHNLQDDVRKSLFDKSHQWTSALGANEFMGGNRPDLSDLAVYGVLNSIEGCMAFKDLMTENAKLKLWYFRVKDGLHKSLAVESMS